MKFEATVSASKSLLNRTLIIQSYFPELKIFGDSKCDDVHLMKLAISNLVQGFPIQAGLSATLLRFIALRVSRNPGVYQIFGSPRLLERPHNELVSIMAQLGVKATLESNRLTVESSGWIPQNSSIRVDGSQSSQFLSGLILNAWKLPFDLEIEFEQLVSGAYFQMTVALVQSLGMTLEQGRGKILIRKNQTLLRSEIAIEPDMSSLFAIATFGAALGSATLNHFPEPSIQPDRLFLEFFAQMGISVTRKEGALNVTRPEIFNSIQADLSNTPDLMPLLAILCSLATGKSRLYGARHLAFKESHRIQKTHELLTIMGRHSVIHSDGLEILELSKSLRPKQFATINPFDCDQDHRIAMAAALVQKLGYPIDILNPEVVSKSFPEFWEMIR